MPFTLLSRIRHSVLPRSKHHEHASTAPQRDLHHLDTTTPHPCATAQPASTSPESKSPTQISTSRNQSSTQLVDQTSPPRNGLLSLPPELLAQILSYLLPAPTAPLKFGLPSSNNAIDPLPITHVIRDHPLANTHPCLTASFIDSYVRATGYDVSLSLSVSNPGGGDDREGEREGEGAIWPKWTNTLRPYVRRLNVSIVWREAESSSESSGSPPASPTSPSPPVPSPTENRIALHVGSRMLSIATLAIADLPQLSSLSIAFLIPAAHLELWPTLPASARIDLQSLFTFPRQDPSSHIPPRSPLSHHPSSLAPRQLDILHTTVRGYHSLYGQLISHLVYSRQQVRGEKAEERGDWDGHRLYPGIWESVWSVDGLLQNRGRDHHSRTKSPNKDHPVV